MRSLFKFAIKLDVDKIKSDNPNLIKEIDELILNDPAKSTNPNIYLLWSIKQLKSGASLFDLIPSIKYFHNNKQAFNIKDINKYNFKQLENTIKDINDKRQLRQQRIETELNKKQLVEGELERLKQQEQKILLSGTEVLLNDDDFIVYYIKHKDASKLLGKDTRWCISMSLPGSMFYEQYTGGNTIFYFVINKNLPETDSLYKTAIAQMRDFNNNVKATQIFNKIDEQINESNIRPDILELTKNDAARRPKGVLAKMHDGELSDQEALAVLDLYKANVQEFYQIIKIFINHYKHLIEKDTEGFIEKYNLNSTMFIFECKSQLNFENKLIEESNRYIRLSQTPGLSEDWIRQNQNKVSWRGISIHQKLSEDFIREFKDKVDWSYISTYQKLSEDFIREFKDKVDWIYISISQKLSENFIREFKDKINWIYISLNQKLSEDFIREFKDKVYWDYISLNQKLSEDFIREFKDKVYWDYISLNQKLSEDFIREFKNKVDIYGLQQNENISQEVKNKFIKQASGANLIKQSMKFPEELSWIPEALKEHPAIKRYPQDIEREFSKYGLQDFRTKIDFTQANDDILSNLLNAFINTLDNIRSKIFDIVVSLLEIKEDTKISIKEIVSLIDQLKKQIKNYNIEDKSTKIKLLGDLYKGQESIFHEGTSIFKVYEDLREATLSIPELKDIKFPMLKDLPEFREYSNRGYQAELVFSTDIKDIVGLADRGVSSCLSLSRNRQECTELEGHTPHVVGTVLSKYIGICYITSGFDFKGRGERMLYRALVRLVFDEKSKSPVILIDKLYPSERTTIYEIMQKEMSERTSIPVLIAANENLDNYFIPIEKHIPEDFRSYHDFKIKYRKATLQNLFKIALKLDIDKIKSDNPSLIKEIDELILNDPAKSTNPNIYLLWSIKQLKSGASLFDLIPSIKYFYNNKQSFKNKDINQYSLKELENEIKNINDKRLERSQITETKLKNKELINQELLRLKEQENQILISGTEIIFQDNDFIIYYIKSKDAAKLLGKDTKWCISMSLPGSMYYEQYTGGNTIFYFVINKNLPENDPLYKIAIAQLRDFNNNVKDIQIFNKLDSQINESNIRSDILQLTKNDAKLRPKGILAKMHDGELSDQEALNTLNLYKINQKEFYEIIEIFVKHYKHLIEKDVEGFIKKYNLNSTMFINKFDNNISFSHELIEDARKFLELSKTPGLSEEFIRQNQNKINWHYISVYQKLSEDFIREFKDKVNWSCISIDQKLSEDFIREFKDNVDWDYISIDQKLSEDFIREFKDNVDWIYISRNQKLSEDFIREFKDKVNWIYISKYQKLSEDFIREFKDYVNWSHISISQKLSEDFIREFKDNVDWYYISEYQKLSEGFIREFKDKVDWICISQYQKLSEDFIREFKDNVDWIYLGSNKNIQQEIKDKIIKNSRKQKLNQLYKQSVDLSPEELDKLKTYVPEKFLNRLEQYLKQIPGQTIPKVFPSIGLNDFREKIEIKNKSITEDEEISNDSDKLEIILDNTEVKENLENRVSFLLASAILYINRILNTFAFLPPKEQLQDFTIIGNNIFNLFDQLHKKANNHKLLNTSNFKLKENFQFINNNFKVSFNSGTGVSKIISYLRNLLSKFFTKFNIDLSIDEVLPKIDEYKEYKEIFKIISGDFYLVFSTKYKDLMDISNRGIQSCQTIGQDYYEGSTENCLFGNILSENTAVIYITSGSDFQGRGERMLYRANVRYMSRIGGGNVILIDRLYPEVSNPENVLDVMKKAIEKRLTVQIPIYIDELTEQSQIENLYMSNPDFLEAGHESYIDAAAKSLKGPKTKEKSNDYMYLFNSPHEQDRIFAAKTAPWELIHEFADKISKDPSDGVRLALVARGRETLHKISSSELSDYMIYDIFSKFINDTSKNVIDTLSIIFYKGKELFFKELLYIISNADLSEYIIERIKADLYRARRKESNDLIIEKLVNRKDFWQDSKYKIIRRVIYENYGENYLKLAYNLMFGHDIDPDNFEDLFNAKMSLKEVETNEIL